MEIQYAQNGDGYRGEGNKCGNKVLEFELPVRKPACVVHSIADFVN